MRRPHLQAVSQRRPSVPCQNVIPPVIRAGPPHVDTVYMSTEPLYTVMEPEAAEGIAIPEEKAEVAHGHHSDGQASQLQHFYPDQILANDTRNRTDQSTDHILAPAISFPRTVRQPGEVRRHRPLTAKPLKRKAGVC